jgi:hypothetical protein
MNEETATQPQGIPMSSIMSQVDSAKEYRPSNKDVLRDYPVQIEFLSIGCLIRVGCKSIPFSTITEGMKAVNDYVANPYETRKIWEERFAKDEL